MRRAPWYRSSATWFAALMVAAAGGAAWYTSARNTTLPPSGPSTTMAATVPHGSPAVATTAVGHLDTGGLPTRVVVADAGIDASIDEVGVVDDGGTPAYEVSWHAAGHMLDTALPGQPGNMVLTGHVSVADPSNLAVFSKLDKVAKGDTVDVYSGAQVYHYKVSQVLVVPPDAVNVLRSNSGSTITLITCTHDLKDRLVVVGTLA
ncbi:MAG: sortase [Tepidiformaceae bacterium]